MVEAVTTYTVTAKRSGAGGALQCVEVPGAISQVRRLSQADDIKEAIAFVAQVPESDIQLALVPELPEGVQLHLDRARVLRDQAASARREAATESRLAAHQLADAGMTMREIGTLLGVSHQRAGQLLSV
jgi:hypothetical protein